MKYDISKSAAPAMPNLGKGTEIIKLLLSQASNSIQEPLVPMFFPVLGAHISGAEFQYPDNSWKEPTGMMANLVAKSGDNKGQFPPIVEAICRDFRQHDKAEEDKYRQWQIINKTEPNNKKKTAEPQLAYWFPPIDTTKPAFIKNAIALEAQGGRTQYFNLPEVEMADQLCGGHKMVSLMLRNIYDRARAGALRATADGITGNPVLRACITISSNPESTRKFYKYELTNGTFGRMVFSYKPRGSREGKIPRLGKFPDEFYQKLDEYLMRLDLSESWGQVHDSLTYHRNHATCPFDSPPKPFDASRYERFFERPWLNDEARRFLFEERKIDQRVVRWCRLTSWKDRQGVPWLQTPYYDREGKLIGIQSRNLIPGCTPRFRFPSGSETTIYNLPVLNLLKPGETLYITEGCSDCWAMLSAGHKAIAIPSATLLGKKDKELLSTVHCQLSTRFEMWPDNDVPGERLFLQLQEVLPSLVRHQLPAGCKDFSEYYLSTITQP